VKGRYLEMHARLLGQIVLVSESIGECYKGVTRVLQECYKSVTRVLQECYKSVTRVLQEHYKCTPSALQECFQTSELMLLSLQDRTRMYQRAPVCVCVFAFFFFLTMCIANMSVLMKHETNTHKPTQNTYHEKRFRAAQRTRTCILLVVLQAPPVHNIKLLYRVMVML
jgi:hypothetical protein